MPHYRSLTKDLEKKVLVLVRRYVDEVALAEEQNGTSSGELRLSVTKLYQYIVADGSLPRQKKLNVEKMIEKAIEVLREEGEEDDGDEIDSDFEGLNEMGLMEPTVRILPGSNLLYVPKVLMTAGRIQMRSIRRLWICGTQKRLRPPP